MPTTQDFRAFAFDPRRVDASGKNVGQRVYWQLYAIENLVRVILHSVLTVQIPGGNWWAVAVAPHTQREVTRLQAGYAGRPWHSTPGRHEIYYLYLSDLATIMRTNSHLIQPVIPDIDQWIARLDQIRSPRNIVGHMNWLSKTDRKRIDVAHADLHELIQQLTTAGVALNIP